MIKQWQQQTGATETKYFSMSFKKQAKRMPCGFRHAVESLNWVFAKVPGDRLCQMLTENNLHLPTASDDGKHHFVEACIDIYNRANNVPTAPRKTPMSMAPAPMSSMSAPMTGFH